MSEEATDTRNWFLRIASGVVFGPVPTKALRLWAEQGRVQPGNEISLDRKNWIPAPSLEELDIVWYLEDNQGNLTGPFNKRAAEKLIADGRVGEGTSIVHKDDADLAHLVRPALENRRRKTADGAPELDFGADDGDANADENALRTECEGLRLRIEVLEKSQKQLLAAAEKECKSHERQLDAERAKVSKLEAELEETRLAAATSRNAANEAAAKHEALVAEMAAKHKAALAETTTRLETALKETTTRLETALAEKSAQLDAARADAKAREEAAQTQAAQSDSAHAAQQEASRAELESLQAEYSDLLAFSNQRDAETKAKIDELEEQADRREKKAAELERRCAELTKKNDELKTELAEKQQAAASASGKAAVQPDVGLSDEADRVFATQIEYLSSLLVDGQKWYKSIQERIDTLVALRSGGLADATERQARRRAEKAQLERSKEEANNLRLENARNQQLADAREQELQRRIRILEIDLSQTKDAAREADALRQRIQQLTEAVNDRDQIIGRERKERAEEQQRLEQAQQALLARLQKSEKAEAAEHVEASVAGKEREAVEPAIPPTKKHFHVLPWMSFKK